MSDEMTIIRVGEARISSAAIEAVIPIEGGTEVRMLSGKSFKVKADVKTVLDALNWHDPPEVGTQGGSSGMVILPIYA